MAETGWAAIEQALREYGDALLGGTPGEVAAAQQKHAAAVGEAKRRESELERERDDLQRKIDGYFLSSGFAWWVEKAEKAEARVAELERALEPFAKAGKKLWHQGGAGYRNGAYDEARELYRFRVGDVLQAWRAWKASDTPVSPPVYGVSDTTNEALGGARREATGD